MIRLRLLGPLALERGDGVAAGSVLAQPKRLALLALLADTRPNALRSRDTLISLLWPQSDQEHGRKSLRQALHALRRSLGPDVVVGEGDELVGVDPARLWCDAAAFRAALRDGRAEEALSLYRGAFLDGFHLPDAGEFERWVDDERRRMELDAVAAAWQLAEHADGSGDRPGARRWAERALELSPYDEAGFRRYLELLERQADRVAAVQAFTAYARRLAEDLGMEPSAETLDVLQRIRAAASAAGPPAAVPAAGPPAAVPAAPVTANGDGAPRPALRRARRRSGRRASAPVWLAVAVVALVLGVFGWHELVIGRGALASSAPAKAAVAGSGTAVHGGAGAHPISSKSVAVLPFQNLSEDRENAYFAAGIQDEILTSLAHIADLKVISRESVMQYGDHPEDVRLISRQLGVANLLEGSVQRVGDRVRITVQLIDARKDTHLWAATYDRQLSDVFAVESEVARTIAAALQATLTPAERQRMATAPTRNTAAYSAYLRGQAISQLQQGANSAAVEEAADAYRRAVGLDSTFALAWARLAYVESELYRLWDHTPARLRMARHATDRAVALDPGAGESRLALGYYYYYCRRDYGRAMAAFEAARKRLPNNAEALAAISYIERRRGHYDAALQYQQRALARDPSSLELLSQTVLTYAGERRFADALRLLNRALVFFPGDPGLRIVTAEIYQARGDFKRAGVILAGTAVSPSTPPVFLTLVQQRLYTHHYRTAVEELKAAVAQPAPTLPAYMTAGVYGERLGFAQRLAGDTAGARASYESARRVLLLHLRTAPDDGYMQAFLGLVEAGLGDSKAALSAAGRALRLEREGRVVGSAALEQIVARIEAQAGQPEAAIARLRKLLKTPFISNYAFGTLTPAFLAADRVWDPLRGDPGFQALVRPPAR